MLNGCNFSRKSTLFQIVTKRPIWSRPDPLTPYNTFKRDRDPASPPKPMIKTIIRTAIRSRLINDGPQTCSDLVRSMGMDPRRHKGTIHALMVDLEKDGVLGATRADNGKRDLWFVVPSQIRKRDRIAAAVM